MQVIPGLEFPFCESKVVLCWYVGTCHRRLVHNTLSEAVAIKRTILWVSAVTVAPVGRLIRGKNLGIMTVDNRLHVAHATITAF